MTADMSDSERIAQARQLCETVSQLLNGHTTFRIRLLLRMLILELQQPEKTEPHRD